MNAFAISEATCLALLCMMLAIALAYGCDPRRRAEFGLWFALSRPPGSRDSGLGVREGRILDTNSPSPVPPPGAADANPEPPISNPPAKDSSFPNPEPRVPKPAPKPKRPYTFTPARRAAALENLKK